MKKLSLWALMGLALASTTAMAHIEDSKPSAMNAPVMQKVVSKQFTCNNGETVEVRFIDLQTIELTTMNGQSILTREYDDTPKTVYPFYRPKEHTHMDTYSDDNSIFTHNATRAEYTYTDTEEQRFKTSCAVPSVAQAQ
ncbi:hypothetical protein [Moraxella sp. ZY210820]|uniref:hypothetical protein n=1 Tax=unclassified Moraxella TaxID=2685852 RepID=UPI002732043E|nr:hypothetical protein [Moraxella sp. ZY210820]WLF84134.1 hypothetical protein LU301_01085 [Moraxella sp. ZY210820]